MAYLPPRVRYDPELSPSAKLLYAEITALAETDGYCWATNQYLAALFSVSEATITRQISQLVARGYLEQRMAAVAKGSERRVYLTDLGLTRLESGWIAAVLGVSKNADTPPQQKCGEGCQQKCGPERIDSINVIPPIVPQRGRRRVEAHRDSPEWKPEAFEKLWKWYPTGELPRPAPRGNRQRAIKAWDKLRPDDELIGVIADALARQAASEQWKAGVGIPHLSTYLNGYGWEGWTDEEG